MPSNAICTFVCGLAVVTVMLESLPPAAAAAGEETARRQDTSVRQLLMVIMKASVQTPLVKHANERR